jgi:hypothetical protein
MSVIIETTMRRSHLGFKITVYNAVMTHESERHEHLTRETTDESSRKPNEAVRLDQLV